MTASPVGITAEALARKMIDRARGNAVRPDLVAIADATALTLKEVQAIHEQMLAKPRPAASVRPTTRLATVTAPPDTKPPPAVEPPRAGVPAALLAWGWAHDQPKVKKATARAASALSALAELRVQLERDDALRAEEARLRLELAALVARRRGEVPGDNRCPQCGKRLASSNGVLIHQARKHRAPAAQHQGPK